jgi:hypothetical protein
MFGMARRPFLNNMPAMAHMVCPFLTFPKIGVDSAREKLDRQIDQLLGAMDRLCIEEERSLGLHRVGFAPVQVEWFSAQRMNKI